MPTRRNYSNMVFKAYTTGACGGTFDHFHLGHEEFLTFALSQCKKLIIGITTDAYIKKHHKDDIEKYARRKKSVEDFLQQRGFLKRVEIVPLNDIFGPTLSLQNIQAIIVSENTKKGARIINKKRKELGLKPLKIVVAALIKDQKNYPISSSHIRNGYINRLGIYYIQDQWIKFNLQINESLRKVLKKPFGRLISDFQLWFKNQKLDPGKTITVGDIITDAFNNHRFGQKISVVDLLVQRKKRFESVSDHKFSGEEKLITVKNPAGFISGDLLRVVRYLFGENSNQRFIIQVLGEEDLAVLPLILAAPLGFTIYYGQPGKGMVEIKITEQSKEKAYHLVRQFVIQG